MLHQRLVWVNRVFASLSFVVIISLFLHFAYGLSFPASSNQPVVDQQANLAWTTTPRSMEIEKVDLLDSVASYPVGYQ